MKFLKESLFRCPIAEQTGYQLKTDFWDNFCLAERKDINAVKDLYEKAFNYAKNDYEYLTELVMILNWKIWQHHEKNEQLARLYNNLWEKADTYAVDNLKDDELSYFLRTTD